MSIIKKIIPLGFVWETADPFLFSVHHQDAYPPGNAALGPSAALTGRDIGQDFDPSLPWRMYHGQTVPGFPPHPHRGFETVTVVQQGFIDHSDSAGAEGRFGNGDVQWMTAGAGLQHAEMFPLVHPDAPNPLELFQIWLNLPAAKKYVKPHYKMLWAEHIPVLRQTGLAVRVISGSLDGVTGPAPAPDSWAANPTNEVGIWIAQLTAGATWRIPAASAGVNRRIYCFEGQNFLVDGTAIKVGQGVEVDAAAPVVVVNGTAPAKVLVLQGRPIGETVVQQGPFVMNDQAGIQKAISDFRATLYGGWPWPRAEYVQPQEQGRFARYDDGRVERP